MERRRFFLSAAAAVLSPVAAAAAPKPTQAKPLMVEIDESRVLFASDIWSAQGPEGWTFDGKVFYGYDGAGNVRKLPDLT
jgi:hypothetical protein